MHTFRVDPDLFRCFPGMHLVVAVVEALDNREPLESVDARWQEAWFNAGRLDVPNAQSHPRVRAWREHFQQIGVSMKKFPTSIEAMLRRALKDPVAFRINPVVDFYNALSMRHICPAGAFDLDRLDEDIALRFTRRGDRFTALDAEETIEVPPGEIAYTSGATVLTRHFMWRQAREGLVSPDSRTLFFVSEIPGVAGPEVAHAMRQDLESGLYDCFEVDCVTFIVDETLTEARW